ncbi:M15 family metallopeptidase [Actinoplanes awajinensis]|uniref:M15 family metallopeptidase n=1 Tax=Actinoplanes awajinensis TaxID=135946 RepID=UPI001E2FCACF|nr:M15 family metallopeptidase [Actinoplanes awajinensis]
MTTRQRTRRQSAAAIIALTAVASALGTPAPTQAATAPPTKAATAAASWSGLMYRSLTREATAAAMRTTYAGQKAAISTWTAEAAAATKAGTTAQSTLTAAVTAETNARLRHAAARKALVAARTNLSTAGKLKPRSATAVTKATNAVTAATKTVTTRKLQYQRYAAALTLARAEVRTAAARLTKATAAVSFTTAAAAKTREAYVALPAAAALATQAGTLSRDVVAQIRPAFKAATDTTLVYSVTVNKTVAFAFKRMVDDARADGVQISGGGFRTTQRQIELRTINGCPDVWTAPASSCRVPTAIPGRSLHEIGLAVDISSAGKTISSKTPAFKWLTVHAKEYGFVNLPAEAWHWSITGG